MASFVPQTPGSSDRPVVGVDVVAVAVVVDVVDVVVAAADCADESVVAASAGSGSVAVVVVKRVAVVGLDGPQPWETQAQAFRGVALALFGPPRPRSSCVAFSRGVE